MKLLLPSFSVMLIFLNHSNALLPLLAEYDSGHDNYIIHLRNLLIEILNRAKVERCLAIITDDIHHPIYNGIFFESSSRLHLSLNLKVENSEDFLESNSNETVRVLNEMKTASCDVHFITISNGVQVKRLLIFLENHRMQRVLLFYDRRLLGVDMTHIWEGLTSNILLRRMKNSMSFSLITILNPILSHGFVVKRNLGKWMLGKSLNRMELFHNELNNFNGISLPTVVIDHFPMVQRNNASGKYYGVEVEIVNALGKAMNFEPKFYESNDSEEERWGRQLADDSFTGLLGQMTNRRAAIAIGDLQLTELHSTLIDLSEPHSQECFTFLTAASSEDNTWMTLILPFSSGGMWLGVLLSLFLVGTLFYVMSWIHAIILQNYADNIVTSVEFFSIFRRRIPFDIERFHDVKFRASLSRYVASEKSAIPDLFDSFANCLLLTYSMLLYVSLPKMPRNWPLRMLTGWYWIYCILLGVAYKASFTAILANPAPRITIDTIEELAQSGRVPSVWGNENKKIFDEAFDDVAREIGDKIQIIDDINNVTDLIAKQDYAYYDNEYFLRNLRKLGTQSGEEDKVLHIMRTCIHSAMPIVLGLQKNSPLKPDFDKYIQRLKEGGFISKWLRDALVNISAEEASPQEALMDINKFWSSLVALAIGHSLSLLAFCAEFLHFRFVVKRHPLYDEYNPRIYYNFKRRFPNS